MDSLLPLGYSLFQYHLLAIPYSLLADAYLLADACCTFVQPQGAMGRDLGDPPPPACLFRWTVLPMASGMDFSGGAAEAGSTRMPAP